MTKHTFLFLKVLVMSSLSIFAFISIIYLFVASIFGPREISYSDYLPCSANEINEKTEYIQSLPDEEYRYYLKAKVSEQEFMEFVDETKLEWASPVHRSGIPLRIPGALWWDPPSSSFLYANGNGADYSIQADYENTTGYMYLYIEQN